MKFCVPCSNPRARAPGQETEAVAGSVRAAKAREAAHRQQGLSKAAAAAAAVGGARKDAKAKKKDARAQKRKLSGAGCALFAPRTARFAPSSSQLRSQDMLCSRCMHVCGPAKWRRRATCGLVWVETQTAMQSRLPVHAKCSLGIHMISACAFFTCGSGLILTQRVLRASSVTSLVRAASCRPAGGGGEEGALFQGDGAGRGEAAGAGSKGPPGEKARVYAGGGRSGRLALPKAGLSKGERAKVRRHGKGVKAFKSKARHKRR